MKKTMQPTTKLRFIKRKVDRPTGYGFLTEVEIDLVLQQYWVPHIINIGWAELEVGADQGEWRDVELVDDAE